MGCSGCGCGGRGWAFFLLRVLITIIILMMTFWFGLVAGRMGGGWDRYYMMRAYPADGTGVSGVVPMMPLKGATSTPMMGGVQNY